MSFRPRRVRCCSFWPYDHRRLIEPTVSTGREPRYYRTCAIASKYIQGILFPFLCVLGRSADVHCVFFSENRILVNGWTHFVNFYVFLKSFKVDTSTHPNFSPPCMTPFFVLAPSSCNLRICSLTPFHAFVIIHVVVTFVNLRLK